MPLHKAVHAAAARSDVLFEALLETQNRGGCLLVIQGYTLSTTPYDTEVWLWLKIIPACSEDRMDRAATVNAPDIDIRPLTDRF